jgi:aromatic ring-opening dioxygenase LigB subunit
MTDLHQTFDEVLGTFYDAAFLARRRVIETGEDEADHWILYEFAPVLEKVIRRPEEVGA